MIRKHRERIVAKTVANVPPELVARRLCDVCTETTGVSGAGIMLMADAVPWASLNTVDPVTVRIEELQFGLLEGPGIDAHSRGVPVCEPDLDEPSIPRWPAFSKPAVQAGVRAVFGFPLRVGGVRLGALNLHSSRPGVLKDEQHLEALILADVVARAILLVQAEAPPARLAEELETASDYQSIVNQASGMAAVQLNIGVGAALVQMRVYAFTNGLPFAEVAQLVVTRKLRFDAERNDRAHIAASPN